MSSITLALALFLAQNTESIEIRRVSQEAIENRLKSYPKKNAERLPALKQMFEQAGCRGDTLAEQQVKGSKIPNVICTQPGAGDSTVLVGAHFDFVERGHGVVDNWSGASLLPSLYQSLGGQKLRHTFVYIGFSGEERGLIGSQFFAKQLSKDQVATTRAMINLDTLGLADTKIWLSHGDKTLATHLWNVSQALQLPLSIVDVERVGTTDSEPFRQRKIPVLSVHSLTQDTLKILHSPQDRIEALNLEAYYNTYRLLATYLVYLDRKLE